MDAAARAHDDVLGYLLKHAHIELERRSDEALAGPGVTSRELGILRVIATGEATSQQEVAATLGIDRTTMVAFTDDLEVRGLVVRRPSERDRRRNVLALTDAGRAVYGLAEQTSLTVEHRFLAALDPATREALVRALRLLITAE